MSKSTTTPDGPPVGDPPADGGAPPAGDPQPAPQPPKPDETLGAGGLKALHAERDARKAAEAKAKELQAQLDAGKPEWQQQINEMQARIDAAEAAAKAAMIAQLRTDRCAAKGVPAEAAQKLVTTLTGETAEAIDTELDDWLPLLNTGTVPPSPRPNPQQGNPSGSRGGSLSAGRDRYTQSRK
ncbi:MAG: hypothetical protein M3Y83_06950 [Actinomycetota bacterium]|nr:hypothetical protein [Actinomycetota bacterium]